MCGIAGFVGQREDRDHVEKMVEALAHRGPDDKGLWVAPGTGLGMRRLSIIDLAGGRPPMTNEDHTLHVVFHGESYNFRELRSDLIQRGHRFRIQSDTEVLLDLYEESGERCVERLRGMFAFALWDAHGGCLFPARDRLELTLPWLAHPQGQMESEGQTLLRMSALPLASRDPLKRSPAGHPGLPSRLAAGKTLGLAGLTSGVMRRLQAAVGMVR